MQSAKDSFYMTLHDRLAVLNADRVVTIDGLSQPAILVGENEPVTSAETFADCFYVQFGAVKMVGTFGHGQTLLSMDATISYRTRGNAYGGADRGRTLSALDSELLAITSPTQAAKRDYMKNPPADLGTTVFWAAPLLSEVKSSGVELSRTATLTLYFYPEEQTA